MQDQYATSPHSCWKCYARRKLAALWKLSRLQAFHDVQIAMQMCSYRREHAGFHGLPVTPPCIPPRSQTKHSGWPARPPAAEQPAPRSSAAASEAGSRSVDAAGSRSVGVPRSPSSTCSRTERLPSAARGDLRFASWNTTRFTLDLAVHCRTCTRRSEALGLRMLSSVCAGPVPCQQRRQPAEPHDNGNAHPADDVLDDEAHIPGHALFPLQPRDAVVQHRATLRRHIICRPRPPRQRPAPTPHSTNGELPMVSYEYVGKLRWINLCCDVVLVDHTAAMYRRRQVTKAQYR